MAWKSLTFLTAQQSYISMLRNPLDFENKLCVRDVHKTDENLNRAKQQREGAKTSTLSHFIALQFS